MFRSFEVLPRSIYYVKIVLHMHSFLPVYSNILPIDPCRLANKFKCNGTFVAMRQAICYLYSFVFALICMFGL